MKEHNIRISEETIDIKANAVTLSTAHKSKGLEFEYVFITKCIDKKWSNVVMRDLIKLPPHILKTIDFAGDKEKKKHQEEDDRRLFYVVLTRAKKSIYITSAKHYQTALYDRSGIPSMFANEIPNENKNLIDVTKIERNTSQVLQQLLKPKRKDAVICDDEEMFLNHSLRNFKLSASSLNTYLQCPYKFKLQFLFRTPQIRTRPLVLGIAVHKSLEVFYREKEKGNEISLDLLLKSFETALSDEILKDIEFTEVLTEGKSILKAYYAVYEDELIMISEKTVILERFLGWGFSKPLLDGKIHLQGKIDKLEVIDEQDKSVRIVDYKTGRPKSRNDILGKTKYSTGDQYRQLLFYKLLIDLDTTFDYTAEEVQLEFIGQRNNKPRREIFSIDQNDLETIKQTIRKVHKGILNLEFGRTTDYKHCSNCRFQNHCWPDGIPND